jgi:hypothetical protein
LRLLGTDKYHRHSETKYRERKNGS